MALEKNDIRQIADLFDRQNDTIAEMFKDQNTKFDQKFGLVDQKIDGLRAEMKAGFTEIKGELAAIHTKIDQLFQTENEDVQVL